MVANPVGINFGDPSSALLTPAVSTILATVGGGSGPIRYQQNFPAAATHLPLLRGKPLVRGSLYQDPRDPLVQGTPLGLQFLYNPTEFEQDYSLDTSRYPSATAPQAGSNLPTLGVAGASSIALNLILDRTWDVNNPQAGDAYKRGIKVDIEQFEKMVGYTARTPFVQAVSMFLYLGHTMRFYGFIQSFNVLYSQFTQDLRPYRGGITGISFQILPYYPENGYGLDQAFQVATTLAGGGTTTDPTTSSTDAGTARTP